MKRGSVLIESMVSIMILMICGSVVISEINRNNKTIQKRRMSYDLNSYANAVIYEIQYNLPEETINENFKLNDIVYIKYDENSIEEITKTDISSLISEEKDSEFCLELKRTDKNKKYINFQITVEKDNVRLSKEFRKSWWMDEA